MELDGEVFVDLSDLEGILDVYFLIAGFFGGVGEGGFETRAGGGEGDGKVGFFCG